MASRYHVNTLTWQDAFSNATLVKTGLVAIYPKPRGKPDRHAPTQHTVRGKLSIKSKRKMFQVIRRWAEIVKNLDYTWLQLNGITVQPRFIFMTVTLASTQIHTDEEIKRKLLNPFITDLGKLLSKSNPTNEESGYERLNYLWRAETQENGNIHFHLIFDRFIPIEQANNIWNRIQDRLGYVQRSTAIIPQGVDIQPVYDINELQKYLAKYLDKKDQLIPPKSEFNPCIFPKPRREVKGKQWGCSRQLLETENVIDEEMTGFDQQELIENAKKHNLKVLESAQGWGTIYVILWSNLHQLSLLCGNQRQLYQSYIDRMKELRDTIFLPVWKNYRHTQTPLPST